MGSFLTLPLSLAQGLMPRPETMFCKNASLSPVAVARAVALILYFRKLV